jgi:uncharacterized protein (TIGR02453 family)
MGFSGFGMEAFELYEGLVADNSKEYWNRHKKTYEESVREPMIELFAELEAEFGPAKMFRPYRDMRFSRGAEPYKTQQGGHTDAGFYFALHADGLRVAGGLYAPSGEQLKRFRAAVTADSSGAELQAIVDELLKRGFELSGDQLKTRPRGAPADHPRLDLLRRRALFAHRGWPVDPWVHTHEVVDRVRESWRDLRPIIEWRQSHVGEVELH